eukprot:6177858-Prymnesium_polylepis.1
MILTHPKTLSPQTLTLYAADVCDDRRERPDGQRQVGREVHRAHVHVPRRAARVGPALAERVRSLPVWQVPGPAAIRTSTSPRPPFALRT